MLAVMRRHISLGSQPSSPILAIVVCIIPDIIWDIILGTVRVANATASPPPIAPSRLAIR